MARITTWLGLPLAAAMAVTVPAAAAGERDLPVFAETVQVIDDLPFIVPVDPGRSVRVRFPVGELDVVAGDVGAVRTSLGVRCDRRLSAARCAKYRQRLRLEGRERDGVVEVRLIGLPKWKLRRLDLEGKIVVPRWAPLEVRVGIGDVDIAAGDEDLAVQMGIGDLTVRAPRGRVGAVRATTRIGDASLRDAARREGGRRRLLGARVDWHDGRGPATIAIGLKIGNADVVLE